MLAIYPEMQDKCYEEIRSVLPNKDDELSYDDLSKLDYVERCLKETMRLFPTVPVVARKVDMDFKLSEWLCAGVSGEFRLSPWLCSIFLAHSL